MTRILVIDDEPLILDAIELAFPNDEVVKCETAEAGVDAFLSSTPDVVLCDIRLPGASGMDVFEKLHEIEPKIPIVLMTGRGTAGTAIEAMQRGAYEYILKPLDPEQLIPLIENAVEIGRITRIPATIPDENESLDVDDEHSDPLIGSCQAMQEVYRSIGRVAKQDVTILLLGESGTGKEVVARAIYHYSGRPTGRFLPINCAAIPEDLLESELFGHEKGAFTGADRQRVGKFELCNNGTLFLDEVGEMSPVMQTKLLRVLQDQTFERVGGSETIRTNARLIAATNVDLEKAMNTKSFRSDLYYRLNVYTINLPPLRERGQDIVKLATFFARRYARQIEKEFVGFSPEVVERLLQYPWPGNVRELQSAVKHALLLATRPIIAAEFLPDAVLNSKPTTSAEARRSETNDERNLDFAALTRQRLAAGSDDILRELVGLAEREIFSETLRATDGNLTQAAKRLGITRATLRSRLETLQLSVEHSAQIRSEP